MAKQNRTVLKTYFESGDIPNQSQYSDLIDSNLNLSENNIGNINLTGDITASGNISASGTIFADNFQSTGGDVAGISFTDDLNLTGNITASGNISASGIVHGGQGRFPSRMITNQINAFTSGQNIAIADSISVNGNITASGNISSSGTITGQNIILGSGGRINVKDTSGNEELFLINNTDSFLGFGDTDQELKIQGNPVEILSSFTSSQDALFKNDVTFEQNITASGDIIASDLILTSPNGSKFKFTVNNSGHLSLTGSAV
tara:strand:+ start:731 stop:1513 length:783 start_codon:yes stop_codon:yes gene_type:complete